MATTAGARFGGFRRWWLALTFVACSAAVGQGGEPRIVDLSLLVAPNYPCTWPAVGFAPFHIDHYLKIGPRSAYNSDILCIDGNTGTQLDVPPHSIPLPETNLPNAGPLGRMTTDRVPAGQVLGGGGVVDGRG